MTAKTYAYRYGIEDNGATFDDAYGVSSKWACVDDSERRWVAEQAAEDYHAKHDGWEASWPLRLTLWRESGQLLGVFDVEREAVPVFMATKVRTP